LLLIAGFVLGFAAHGIKICVDTLVQQVIEDDFRGRVFSLYDTLFNITFVLAAVVTAVLLPDTGYSPASVIALGVIYALTGFVYLRAGSRLPSTEFTPEPLATAARPPTTS
jgi:MFS family permease